MIVVAGYGRCGTTMMMGCLEAGGYNCSYSNRELRELGTYELWAHSCKPQDYNIVVKAPRYKIMELCPGDYRVILMVRDPDEIEASCIKKFGGRPTKELVWMVQQDILDYCVGRRDFELMVLDYNDIVERPHEVMMPLVGFLPDGLDVCRAADTVVLDAT